MLSTESWDNCCENLHFTVSIYSLDVRRNSSFSGSVLNLVEHILAIVALVNNANPCQAKINDLGHGISIIAIISSKFE